MGEFNVDKTTGGLNPTAGMPETYPADQVMLSDGVTSVEDALDEVESGLTNVSSKIPIWGGFNIHCVQGINVFDRNTLTLVSGSIPSSSFAMCLMSITNHGSNYSTLNTVETDGTDIIIINSKIEQNLYITWLDMSNIPKQP